MYDQLIEAYQNDKSNAVHICRQAGEEKVLKINTQDLTKNQSLCYYCKEYFTKNKRSEYMTTAENIKCVDSPDDKAFFALYINEARHNLYITLKHDSEKLNQFIKKSYPNETVSNIPDSDDELSNMPVLQKLQITNKNNIKIRNRALEYLRKSMPMIDYMISKQNKEDLDQRAKKYYDILHIVFRSINSMRNHFSHKNEPIKPESDKGENLASLLWEIYPKSINYVKKNFGWEESDFKHLRLFSGKNQYNKNFYYSLFKEKNQEAVVKNRRSLTICDLSEKGIVYFICFFLSRHSSELLLKKIRGFKNSESNSYRATLECFKAFAIKIPKPKIKSDTTKQSLLLDIVQELRQSPKILYSYLSNEDKKQFYVEDSEGSIIKLTRSRNRFSELALRYCDEFEVFTNLRFQIDIGRYFFKTYSKTTIDGEHIQCYQDKQLKIFGRLQTVMAEIKKIKEEKQWPSENPLDTPYLDATIPHHHIIEDQHCIYISKSDNYKKIIGRIDKANDKVLQQDRGDAVLSLYDLPVLIFCGFLVGFEEIEAKLFTFIDNYQRTSEKVADELEYRKRKLQNLIDGAEKRYKNIQHQLNNKDKKLKGKKDDIKIRPGELAQELAKDFLFYQKKYQGISAGKITAANFQALQKSLAYYTLNKKDLKNIFKKANLIESSNPHPFLKDIDPGKCNGILDFYIKYIERKISFLQGINCNNTTELEGCDFLRLTRHHNVEEQKKHPVNIDSRFFREIIMEGTSYGKQGDSSAYLIGEYFKKEENDNYPEYYDYSRMYDLHKKLENKFYKFSQIHCKVSDDLAAVKKKVYGIKKQKKEDDEKRRKKLIIDFKKMRKNEIKLNHFKMTDIILYKIFKEKFKEEFPEVDFTLPGLREFNKNIWDEEIGFSMSFSFSLDNNSESKELTYKGKLKDIGKFYHYLYDRRLPGLLTWKNEKSLSVDEIEKELKEFENCKETVISIVLDFEDKIFQKTQIKHPLHEDNREKIKHSMQSITEEEFDQLCILRNKLLHNQFPSKNDLLKGAEGANPSEKFQSFAKKILEKWEK